MTLGYNPSGLLVGSQNRNQLPKSFLNKKQAARAAGAIEAYEFQEIILRTVVLFVELTTNGKFPTHIGREYHYMK
mgnify:CR=1 FL=1